MAKILIYGNDPTLLMTRRLILEHEGLHVFTTMHIEEEAELISHQQPEVLILCQTLSADQREFALVMTRTLRPNLQALVLMEAGLAYDLATDNYEHIYALDGPGALVTVTDMLAKRSNSTAAHA
jgi:CheY-like chemotaxis protein